MRSWPPGSKFCTYTTAMTDLKEFMMSFKAGIESAEGDKATMAKASILAIKGIALS